MGIKVAVIMVMVVTLQNVPEDTSVRTVVSNAIIVMKMTATHSLAPVGKVVRVAMTADKVCDFLYDGTYKERVAKEEERFLMVKIIVLIQWEINLKNCYDRKSYLPMVRRI